MTEGTWWWRGGIVLAFVAACAPHSIEFEHTDGGAGRAPEETSGGTAGTTPAGAGSGGTSLGTGGAAGSAVAGRGGSNGIASPDPEFNLGCDYKTIVSGDCAKTGCHRGSLSSAKLDLSGNSLVARLKDVPATFLEIQCSALGEPYMECIPAACPRGTLLVDSDNWEQSFMLTKLRGTQNGCGTAMPDDTYLTAQPERAACIEALIHAIADLPPH